MIHDVLIVDAGHAGLGVALELKRKGMEHVQVVDANAVGATVETRDLPRAEPSTPAPESVLRPLPYRELFEKIEPNSYCSTVRTTVPSAAT
jgi:thioredoxin reductase